MTQVVEPADIGNLLTWRSGVGSEIDIDYSQINPSWLPTAQTWIRATVTLELSNGYGASLTAGFTVTIYLCERKAPTYFLVDDDYAVLAGGDTWNLVLI